MKNVITSLFELQKTQLLSDDVSDATLHDLRRGIPEDVLSVFDRCLARGRKAVASIRNGVCGECHLRLPVGTLVEVMHGDQLMRCGNCGRYLYLPEDAPVTVSTNLASAPAPACKPTSSGASRPRRKKAELTAQAA